MAENRKWHKKTICATFAAVFLFISLLSVGLWYFVLRQGNEDINKKEENNTTGIETITVTGLI